jgi:hypothetical protein
MQPLLPTADIMSNHNTWLVPTSRIARVAHAMTEALPCEKYDPHFHGQTLQTTYFDTAKLELRKNRQSHAQYITLRLRCYYGIKETYAVSAKTESEKFRVEISQAVARALQKPMEDVNGIMADILPPHLLARLMDVSHEQPLVPAVTIFCQRYAVENTEERFTLDCAIETDSKKMSGAVLEYKNTDPNIPPSLIVQAIGLRPIKLSKFLWSTEI